MAKLVAGTKIVTDFEAGSLNPEDVGAELPPAGHERNETLRRRIDALQEKIDAMTNSQTGVDRVAFDPSKLEKENEILNFIEQGSFPVINADDEVYQYCWVNRDLHGRFGGTHVYRKRAQGWKICRFGEPEEAGTRSPEGYCVIGDVLLMRITKDRYLLLHRRQQKLTDLRRQSASSELRQIGDKARSSGIITTIENEVDDGTLNRMAKNAEAERRAKATTDKWIKAGRMPGVAAPGVR